MPPPDVQHRRLVELARRRWTLPDIPSDSHLWRTLLADNRSLPSDYDVAAHACGFTREGVGDDDEFSRCMGPWIVEQQELVITDHPKVGKLGYEEPFFVSSSEEFGLSSLRRIQQPLLLAVSGTHDSSVAVMHGSAVVLAVELERLTGKRHYELLLQTEIRRMDLAFNCNSQRDLSEPAHTRLRSTDHRVRSGPGHGSGLEVLKAAIDIGLAQLRSSVALDLEAEAVSFDMAVVLDRRLIPALELITPMKRWLYYSGHHSAHAALGFYDSPFERALIISFDSGGSDGCFNVYRASWESGATSSTFRAFLSRESHRRFSTAGLAHFEHRDDGTMSVIGRIRRLVAEIRCLNIVKLGQVSNLIGRWTGTSATSTRLWVHSFTTSARKLRTTSIACFLFRVR
jgi:hypothetical protein